MIPYEYPVTILHTQRESKLTDYSGLDLAGPQWVVAVRKRVFMWAQCEGSGFPAVSRKRHHERDACRR